MIVKHTTAEGRTVTAEVVEGTVRDNLRRAEIMRAEVEAMKAEAEETGEVQSMVITNLLRLNAYPSCMACTRSFTDSDKPDLDFEQFTFEDYLDIPDQFLTKWTTKVFELNPGWSESNLGPRVRPSNVEETTKSTSTSD